MQGIRVGRNVTAEDAGHGYNRIHRKSLTAGEVLHVFADRQFLQQDCLVQPFLR